MNISEIENEIKELKNADTNWQNVQQLAWLYIVHDHLQENGTNIKSVTNTMPRYSGEFGEAVSGADIDGLMNVLSEHMSVAKVLMPKEYQAVLDRIANIPR